MKLLLPISTTSKQQLINAHLTMTIPFLLKDWDAHPTTTKIYEKDPQTLSEVISILEIFNAA